MTDPYAPPADPVAATTSTTYAPRPETPAPYDPTTYESPRERRLRHERDRDRPRAEPARLGPFWTIAAVGVGLLCLARLVLFFAVSGGLPGNQVAGGLFAVVGLIAVAAGLACAVLQRGLATPWRIALLLGAAYFASVGGPVVNAFRLF